jgi:hypothetical protein
VFSAEAARPKLERLNPINGLKRIFSVQGLMELGKTLLKFVVLTGIARRCCGRFRTSCSQLGKLSPLEGMAKPPAWCSSRFWCWRSACADRGGRRAVPALEPRQSKLRMTRQEIKDELKETEGSPEMRGRCAAMQQEVASPPDDGATCRPRTSSSPTRPITPWRCATPIARTGRRGWWRRARIWWRADPRARGEHGVPLCSRRRWRARSTSTPHREEIPPACTSRSRAFWHGSCK